MGKVEGNALVEAMEKDVTRGTERRINIQVQRWKTDEEKETMGARDPNHNVRIRDPTCRRLQPPPRPNILTLQHEDQACVRRTRRADEMTNIRC